MHEALLLDVGYVVIELTWPAVEAYEATTGTNGPGGDHAASAGDAEWQQHVAGAITADRYWDKVARSRGHGDFLTLFRGLAEVVPDELFDRNALALMREAQAAGRRVGVLTNDSYSFIGRDFFADRPEFAGLDAFVDATDIGARKPAPEAYLAAANALAATPGDIVFLDDTPECVEGARRVGMVGILVDPFDRLPAFDQARELLGLAAGQSDDGRRRPMPRQ
ncbi:MAG: HAD-IA family hydrolase [Acidimicrobiales bacterium]